MSHDKKYLIVLVGPTAVGKTESAIALSQAINGVIISSDSRQIYKELSIGVAKPTSDEIKAGNIKLVDYVSIVKPYSAGIYETDALNAIYQSYDAGLTPILSGGTGLYIKAVCEGLDKIPTVPEEVNLQIEQDLLTDRAKALDELHKGDSQSFATVDRDNDRRIIRMLGVMRVSGKPFSSFLNQPKAARGFIPIYISLMRQREELYDRINTRVHRMMDNGLIDEVYTLIPHRHLRALDTVGYTEVFGYMDGLYSLGRAIELIQQNSRRYAKRQLTWIRNQMDATSFHPHDFEGLKTYVNSYVKL